MGRPASRQVDYTPYSEFRLCREMGWTFTELEEQPGHRVLEAMVFLEIESDAQRSKGG